MAMLIVTRRTALSVTSWSRELKISLALGMELVLVQVLRLNSHSDIEEQRV